MTTRGLATPPRQLAEASGLSNVHKTAHPSLLPVATCNQNRRNIPIDGIWCSPSIDVVSAGMTGFGSLDVGKIDHRILWADFYDNDLFGYRPPPLAPIVQQAGISL
jgi:hypothetical protein